MPHQPPNLPSFALQILVFLLETHCSHYHRCTSSTNLFLYHLGTGSCLPKTTSEPKLTGSWARGTSQKLLISAAVEASKNCGTHLGLTSNVPRNNIQEQNQRGSGLGEPPYHFETLYLFLQPLKLATSNLVYNFDLASSLPKNNGEDANWSRASWARDYPPK